jgi:hypothetical protein
LYRRASISIGIAYSLLLLGSTLQRPPLLWPVCIPTRAAATPAKAFTCRRRNIYVTVRQSWEMPGTCRTPEQCSRLRARCVNMRPGLQVDTPLRTHSTVTLTATNTIMQLLRQWVTRKPTSSCCRGTRSSGSGGQQVIPARVPHLPATRSRPASIDITINIWYLVQLVRRHS